jgi:hypothetical protein
MLRNLSVRAATSLLIAVLLSLAAVIQARAQEHKERTWTDASGNSHSCNVWTWKDRARNSHSCADLDEILKQHQLWLDSLGKSGSQADLNGASLENANLSGAFLRDANLTSADLIGADLREATLSGAFLRGANLIGADLRDTALDYANLRDTELSYADLRGASVFFAHLDGVRFEPKNLPKLESIAYADGLESMTYDTNPGPLTALRKQFQDAGYRGPERAITCALNRGETEREPGIEYLFKRVAFDLTCEYGFSPGRPLRIVGFFWLLFSFVYAVFMHLSGTSGIYFVGTRVWRGRSNTQGIQIRPKPIAPAKWWKRPFLWLQREWRVLRAAMFFSLMSAFNIGFRDINFGRWLRGLTKHEYDLKAVGWARTVSGFQSLLSVYLIALWVLSYFGRPFG